MTQRQQRLVQLQGIIKADTSEGKSATKAEQEELRKLALEEKAALVAAQTPAKPQPIYPIGLEASFGGKWVKILNAWQDAGGRWFYQVDAKLGLPFGMADGEHTLSQDDIRAKLIDALGAMAPTQAYPRGISIFRNGKGGLVESAAPGPAGEYVYNLRGWPNAVGEGQMLAILRQA